MRRPYLQPLTALVAVGVAVACGLASCTQSDGLVARETDAGATIFAPPDATAALPDPSQALMCPVTTCTLPWATCASSEFPCSTNLMIDNDNCGACGVRCAGADRGTRSKSTCVDGKCTFSCDNLTRGNCDDDPSNGCETSITSDDNNCGACGVKCPPERWDCTAGVCVDPCLEANLPDWCGEQCKNLQIDDSNCGECGKVCDPTGPNLPALPASMYYGCANGKCGQRKCSVVNTADCNNDPSDGCEAAIHTNEHCGGCYDACPAGKTCGDLGRKVYACLCLDDTETLCGLLGCISLQDDPLNCGACSRVCPGMTRPHFLATCSFGVCGGECEPNYADCDSLKDNGCEVNISVDNRHCGGCGNACLPNQVCFQGTCQVAPCDAGAPGDPTK